MGIEYENITDKNQGRDLDFSSSQLSELFNQNELNPIKNSNFVNSMNDWYITPEDHLFWC
jgi:hypothetical protein